MSSSIRECVFCLLIMIHIGFADLYCNEQSECTGQSLQDASTVNCFGFDSCSKATVIISGSDFYAYGAYSAYHAAYISSGSSAYCRGESSCRHVDYLESNNHIYCQAIKSCFETTLIRWESASWYGDIVLNGYKSGAYSTLNLYGNTDIWIRGALSLYQAQINMYKSSRVYAYAAFGLSGANLYCESSQICTIYCYAFGCANIASATGLFHNFINNNHIWYCSL